MTKTNPKTMSIRFEPDQYDRVCAYRDAQAKRAQVRMHLSDAIRILIDRGLSEVNRKRGDA